MAGQRPVTIAEAQRDGIDAKTALIRRAIGLAGELARAVWRHRMRRQLLVNRRLALADRRAARCKDETVYAVVPTGFQIIQRADHIDGAVAHRIGNGWPDAGIRGEMNDRIDSGDDPARQGFIANIAGDQLDAAAAPPARQRSSVCRIERDDRADASSSARVPTERSSTTRMVIVAARQQQPDDISADKAAAARDKPAHRYRQRTRGRMRSGTMRSRYSMTCSIMAATTSSVMRCGLRPSSARP